MLKMDPRSEIVKLNGRVELSMKVPREESQGRLRVTGTAVKEGREEGRLMKEAVAEPGRG